MSKEKIKFIGKVNRRFPQLFPKNNKSFSDGEFAILNFDVYDVLLGEIETNKYGNISVKGYNFPSDYSFDKEYLVLAELESVHPTYGKQWNSLMCTENIDLKDKWQQKIFFQSFLTDGQIHNLFEKFEDPLKILESGDSEKLKQVKGIGDKIANKILIRFENNKDYTEAYVELASYGMTPHMIKRLVDQHGSAKILVSKIKENPYILANEVKGIGFKTVDEMALNAGLPRMSKLRLRAFIEHILNEGAMAGYSWISSGVLLNKVEEELDMFPLEDVISVVTDLKEQRVLWDGERGKVALQRYYKLEMDIKNELIRIKNGENKFNFEGWENRVKQAEKLQGWDYTLEQKQSIKDVLDNQLNIITGLGGVGKTFTVLGALKALGDISFAQCALSGKASARLEEATGYPSSTIHRLLGFNPSGYSEENPSSFMYNKDKQLDTEVIVLDEFSMVGGRLFLSLLEAIPTGAKFIMIGDEGQLPSIGALNIASDLTNSSHIPTSELTIIHRQAQKSAVITESKKVRFSEQIVDKGWYGKEVRGELQDLELDIYENKDETVGRAVAQFEEKLKMSGDDIMEVQLIVPMNIRGKSSVYSFNNLIQPIWNPSDSGKKEVYLSLEKDKGYTLRVGDKVINVKNNYKMPIAFEDENPFDINVKEWSIKYDELDEIISAPVFNGYLGEIIDITENDEIVAHFPLIEQTVIVPVNHWRKEKGIQLAYAITCHKCQGSSLKYPICVLDNSHYTMLSREWIYTAMTRSSKYCTIVAQNKALRTAISQTAVKDKQTFLPDLLNDN